MLILATQTAWIVGVGLVALAGGAGYYFMYYKKEN